MAEHVGSGSAKPGPRHSSCLNPLAIAFNETCNGKSWYTSTKPLQLASSEFCVACRTYPTLHLKVDPQTPRWLLVTTDAPAAHPKRFCRTRVPRLRARRVTWNMTTAAELREAIPAMADVDYLEFGGDFDGSLGDVAWPQRLKTIAFCHVSPFNQPLELVKWPPCLENIFLGKNFNHPIERATFPPSLQQLMFDSCSQFNQTIAGDILPRLLQQLHLGGSFNQPIDEVVWPPSLQRLKFGEYFNQPIERAKFPASLRHLSFGWVFNRPIEAVSWPDSLHRLLFGSEFNQPVENVRWPASLRELSLGWCRDIDDNRMIIYSKFNQRIGSSIWPSSLRRLTLAGDFRQSLQGLGTWMPSLEELRVLHWQFDSQTDSLLCGILWPKGLRELTVFRQSNLDGVEVPSTVMVYRPALA